MRHNVIWLLLAGSGFLTGCQLSHSNLSRVTTVPPHKETLVFDDVSKSTIPSRSPEMLTTFNVGMSLMAPEDTIRLFRFGHTVEEVYSGLPTDRNTFALLLAKTIKPSDPIPGTNYADMLEKATDIAATDPEPEICILICGDGEDDYAHDPESLHRFREAANRLARNPRLKWIRLVGVNPGTREELRSVLKPVGDKLQIFTFDQYFSRT